MPTVGIYGLMLYLNSGLEMGPDLWLGTQILNWADSDPAES